MSTFDPYAPPSADLHPHITDFEVFGDKIRAYSPLVLPDDLCVKCGKQSNDGVTKTKKLFWTPTWVMLTFLISWVITLVLHLILRKRLDASYHLCAECNGSRKVKIWSSAGVMVATLVLFFVGVGNDTGPLLAIGGLGFVAALIALIVFAMPAIRPESHKDGLFVVKGANMNFLHAVQTQKTVAVEPHQKPADPAPQNAVW